MALSGVGLVEKQWREGSVLALMVDIRQPRRGYGVFSGFQLGISRSSA